MRQVLQFVLRTMPLVALAACSAAPPGDVFTDEGSVDRDGVGAASSAVCTDRSQGVAYKAFDDTNLVESRVEGSAFGADRLRVKSHAVMFAELERVLGRLPAGAETRWNDAADSFDVAPARWLSEPKATGVGMATHFELAFRIAHQYVSTNPSTYGTMPTADSALTVCDGMAHRAWRRKPKAAEVQSCVELLTNGLADEKDVARRWAYGMASIFSTAEFLTY